MQGVRQRPPPPTPHCTSPTWGQAPGFPHPPHSGTRFLIQEAPGSGMPALRVPGCVSLGWSFHRTNFPLTRVPGVFVETAAVSEGDTRSGDPKDMDLLRLCSVGVRQATPADLKAGGCCQGSAEGSYDTDMFWVRRSPRTCAAGWLPLGEPRCHERLSQHRVPVCVCTLWRALFSLSSHMRRLRPGGGGSVSLPPLCGAAGAAGRKAGPRQLGMWFLMGR